MRRPDVIAPSGPAGQEGAEGADKGVISKGDGATHGATVIQFRPQRQHCTGCGQHLAQNHEGETCPRCRAWDALLRAMSLRSQALGDLMRAGGW